jgi:DNA replication protein DnaC
MNRKTTTLRDRVLDHLRVLKVPASEADVDRLLELAERDSLSLLAALDRFLGEQAARRLDRTIGWRMRTARFPESKTLEGFDWDFNKTIDRAQYEQLATGDFIRRHVNVVLIGQSGVGKSHLMQAVGQTACALGYRVFYTTSAQMLHDLVAGLADKTLPDRLRRYANWELLIIDEFLFEHLEREDCRHAAALFYKVISSRYLKRSTILVTNVDFDAWATYLGDAPLAMAMLDRLVDGAVVIRIKGRSFRAARRPTP